MRNSSVVWLDNFTEVTSAKWGRGQLQIYSDHDCVYLGHCGNPKTDYLWNVQPCIIHHAALCQKLVALRAPQASSKIMDKKLSESLD